MYVWVYSFILFVYFDTLRVRLFKKFLYKSLPVKTKMAFLSRILILLAILLYEQFIHHIQAGLRPNTQYLSAQQYAYHSFLSYCLV